MKVLLQRVQWAKVEVDQKVVGEIDAGLLVFLGVEKNDNEALADKLLQKLLAYRVFSDDDGKMNRSLADVEGGLLVVSQFTLVANTGKGLRPSFSRGAAPDHAQQLYQYFLNVAKQKHGVVESGVFAADMQVSLLNDGPVTFLLDA
ncbi:MAG: D-tyrosyl-tRNA(Tyr) deacylase [Moraxellaceae bacterium]|nr:MAG: D-tyrosyl-tRNA(Tyr) deacylase [Moraxellaceae bacterium]